MTDSAGLAVPGVAVTASATDVTTQRTAVTDGQGRALIVGLEPSTMYVVTSELQGFTSARNENVLVRSGQTVTLRVALTVGGLSETVQVVSESPVIDTKSATTGADITLQMTESLPTGRSYQSYLQFVPSVFPTNDVAGAGNPAARGGVNYSDIGGTLGSSSDNFYYFNGINVTDPVTGTFGSNLNTEIIQEQKVLTGGIPAEFAGTAGLLSNVITKSGSNRFTGTANYYTQSSKLVSENKNAPNDEFSTYDTAVTFGGPVVLNKAWFFGSYRQVYREDDVTAQDTQAFLRTVKRTDKQGYAKATWAPTANDTLGFTFINDPTEIGGSRDRTRLNTRDFRQDQGGNNYNGTYSRLFGNLLLDVAYNEHQGEVSQFSALNASANTVVYRGTDVRTLADEQLGGFGNNLVDERDSKGVRGAAQYAFGRHIIKGGVEWARNENFRNRELINDATFTSISNQLSGVTAAQLAAGGFSSRAFNSANTSDFGGLIGTINQLPNRNEFYALYDANGDGTISAAELGPRLSYTSTAGNPDGRINYSRTFQSQDGPQLTRSQGLTFFAQDQVSLGRLSLNLGVRTERWEHFATTGENIFTFDWAFAPRLSASYDLLGNGKQKVFAYYGRYYDPIRNNMTNFAGTLTGAVREEQVYLNNQWVTYRIRGGQTQQDAFFSPTTKTPYTDDVMVGYEVDLGRNLSLATNYTNRRTRDILEDYDLALYALDTSGNPQYGGDISAPNSLWLGLDYFGYAQNPGSNFVIGTLAGGKRDYQGLEVTMRKRYSDRWQGIASYTYSKAEGNTNSDSNADFQGDVLFLDPRAPFQFGRQPGSIPHLFKAAGSYTFPFHLELGAGYRWNSGTIASRTFRASRRNLPVQVSVPYVYGGVEEFWLAPDAVGSLQNPSWGQLDLRLSYRKLDSRFKPEFFVDVFNVTDNQDAVRNQDLVAGDGGIAFGQNLLWVEPRRLYLGVRLGF